MSTQNHHLRPHLWNDLRLALSVLYSLPTTTTTTSQQQNLFVLSSKDAHEYLMNFQSRNVRRKLKSLTQRKTDQQNYDNNNGSSSQQIQQQQHPTLDGVDYGSSWLACLALLSSLIGSSTTSLSPSSSSSSQQQPQQQPVHYAEALFAAQTLNHRLRKVNLREAIDIEIEPPMTTIILSSLFVGGDISSSSSSGNNNNNKNSIQPIEIYNIFLKWRELLGGNTNFCDLPQPSSEKDEDCIKGEINLLILGELIYCLTLRFFKEGLVLDQIRPLLSTLASALAVIAARIRYNPMTAPHPAPNTQPVVTMIIQTLQHVHKAILCGLNHGETQERLMEVYSFAVYTCLSSIPDAILAGCESRSNGRLSIEPRCYTALTTEVRTGGINLICQSFVDLPAPHGMFRVMFLTMCEEWAKYVPLPFEFVESSIPMVQSAFSDMLSPHISQLQINEGHAAMRYWIAIMEGGSWHVDEILSASLLQSSEASQQGGKKRQSSKSKRRQKEALDGRTTVDLMTQAQNELEQRGTVACRTTILTWTTFRSLLTKDLASVSDRHDEVLGDFAVGGITACATACLPFLLRRANTPEHMNLFELIGQAVADVCNSPSQMVRGFASEPLYSLQASLSSLSSNGISITEKMQDITSNLFFQCTMNLAVNCAYPTGYFDDLTENNDEELENERNDVRDVLRSVSSIPSSSESNNQISASVVNVAGSTLQRLLQACRDSILTSESENSFPEPALHAFSALSKSLNSLASVYAECPSDSGKHVLDIALDTAVGAGQKLVSSFSVSPISTILPLCRIYNLASASFAPMLSTLANIPNFRPKICSTVSIFIQVATESLVTLPELTAPSTLRQSRFDIRGAMRSPGGEDHVGVLTLMRLTSESEQLTQIFLGTRDGLIEDLCHLYRTLKIFEHERGRGVLHGKGVLPKSRRILLGILCHLSSTVNANGSVCAAALDDMFMKSVKEIASLRPHVSNPTADLLNVVCENVFDMAAYSPRMVQAFFDFDFANSTLVQSQYLDVLQHLGDFGYEALSNSAINDPDLLFQWNRLRAALFTFLQQSRNPDLPMSAVNAMITWTKVECQAIQNQCCRGPASASSIFCEDLICEESVPSGITIRVLAEMIDDSVRRQISLDSMVNCIRVMFEVRMDVLTTITCECPDPHGKGAFADPRPILAESWFLATSKILESMAACSPSDGALISLNAVESIVVDSCVSCIGLLFYPSMGATQGARINDPGMSLDGPQSLLSIEFLRLYFLLGPPFLQAAAKRLVATIPVDKSSVHNMSSDDDAVGMAIIGSSIFRAAQGGLPPWAIEYIPGVYSSIYFSLNGDPLKFRLIFAMSMELRATSNFGSVRPGKLLSGKYFESMSDRNKNKFLEESVALAQSNTTASWRQLKVLIKKACGGKKKDTDFRQKPGLTKWDCLDRI